jgi:hypothetical protein
MTQQELRFRVEAAVRDSQVTAVAQLIRSGVVPRVGDVHEHHLGPQPATGLSNGRGRNTYAFSIEAWHIDEAVRLLKSGVRGPS